MFQHLGGKQIILKLDMKILKVIRDFLENWKEDARKFYVAISRAKIRLFLMIIDKKIVYSSKNKQSYEFPVEKSRFIQCIENFFEFDNILLSLYNSIMKILSREVYNG